MSLTLISICNIVWYAKTKFVTIRDQTLSKTKTGFEDNCNNSSLYQHNEHTEQHNVY